MGVGLSECRVMMHRSRSAFGHPQAMPSATATELDKYCPHVHRRH